MSIEFHQVGWNKTKMIIHILYSHLQSKEDLFIIYHE